MRFSSRDTNPEVHPDMLDKLLSRARRYIHKKQTEESDSVSVHQEDITLMRQTLSSDS